MSRLWRSQPDDEPARIVGNAESRGSGQTNQVVCGQQNILNILAMPNSLPAAVSVNPPWHAICPELIGRQDLERNVLDAFKDGPIDSADTSPQLQVLHGVGGSGKTALALSIAYSLRAEYHSIFWINAGNSDSVAAATIQICSELGASPYDIELIRLGHKSMIDVLRSASEGSELHRLIIVDGADDAPTLELVADLFTGGVANATGGAMLLTTRLRDSTLLNDNARWRRIEPLDPRSGSELVRLTIGNSSEPQNSAADGEDLSRLLGGLPLALRVAGKHIAYTSSQSPLLLEADEPKTVRQYVEALNANSTFPSTPRIAGREDLSSHSVTSTWSYALDYLGQSGRPEARAIFYLLSLLAQQPIPLSVVRNIEAPLGSTGSATSLQTIRDVLHGLANFGLLEFTFVQNDDGQEDIDGRPHDAVVLHPVARRVASSLKPIDSVSDGELREATIDAFVLTVKSVPDSEVLPGAELLLLADHLQEILSWPDVEDTSLHELIAAARTIGHQLEVRGLYTPAVHLLERACEESDLRWTEDNRHSIDMHMAYAYLLLKCRRLETARDEYLSLLDIVRDKFSAGDCLLIELRHYVAITTRECGPLVEALEEFEQLLSVAVESLGPRDDQTLLTRGEYAAALLHAGRHSESHREFRITLEVLQSKHGANSRFVMECRRNMVNCLLQLREWEEAKRQLEFVRDDFARVGIPDSPLALHYEIVYLRVLNELSSDISNVREVERLLQHMAASVSSDDPLYSLSQGELLPILIDLGRLDEAEGLCRRLVANLSWEEGRSLNGCIAHMNLVLVLEIREDYLEARNELLVLNSLCEPVLGSEHPLTREIADKLELYSEATRRLDWQYRASDPLVLLTGHICEELEAELDVGCREAQSARQSFLLRLAESGQLVDLLEQSEIFLDGLSVHNVSGVEPNLLAAWSELREPIGSSRFFGDALNRICEHLREVSFEDDKAVECISLASAVARHLGALGRPTDGISLLEDLVPRGLANNESLLESVMHARYQLGLLQDELGMTDLSREEFSWVLDSHFGATLPISHNFIVCQLSLGGSTSVLSPRLNKLFRSKESAIDRAARMMHSGMSAAVRQIADDVLSAPHALSSSRESGECEIDNLTEFVVAELSVLVLARLVERGELDDVGFRLWEGLSDALASAGLDRAAEKQYRGLLATLLVSIGPDSTYLRRVRLSLGMVVRRLGKPRDAEAEFRDALGAQGTRSTDLDPDPNAVRLELARALHDQGRHADADAELRRVVDNSPSSPKCAEAALFRAAILGRSGGEAALDAYRAAVSAASDAYGINHHDTLVVYASAIKDLELLEGSPVSVHGMLDRHFRVSNDARSGRSE